MVILNFAEGNFFSVFTIRVTWSLSMWLYWEDGFLMWLKTKYMLLMLYVNMNVSVGSDLVCYATIGSVYNYVVRILGYHGR